jgi:hypothetical protein
MLKQSAFVSDTSRAKLAGEEKYYIIFSVILFVSGALLLMIPIFDKNGVFILLESWVLLLALVFCIIRPLIYSRGIADAVMAVFTAVFYGVLEFSLGSNLTAIENFRLLICISLFLTGILRILAFTQMMTTTSLPLLTVCGISEMTAAVLIFFEVPSSGAQMIYFFIGMTVIISACESFLESAKLNAKVHF